MPESRPRTARSHVRPTALVLAATLAATMLVSLAVAEPARASDHSRSLEENSHPDWMAEISDDVSLAALSIPGTHDSLAINGGSLVVTQEYAGQHATGGAEIGLQTGAGVRAVDIRVRVVDGDAFAIHHGAVYQNANFDDVMRRLRSFLEAHPTETVLMHLKAECTGEGLSCTDMGGNSTETRRREIFDSYVSRYPGLMWEPSVTGTKAAPMPTLGEVRGKVVLAGFNGPHDGNYRGYGLAQLTGASWSSENDAAPNCYFQNTWNVKTISHIDDKWRRVQDHLGRTNAAQDCADPSRPNADKMYWNFTSGASGGAHPYTVAEGTPTATGVNNFLLQCLQGRNNRCDTPSVKRTGVVMMDFPGQVLVNEILRRNPTSPGWQQAMNLGAGDPRETHPGGDDGGTRPAVPSDHARCRPDGMAATRGVTAPYCDVYGADGREWLGEGRTRRVIGYFSGGRTGKDGKPHYLVPNIPWSKVTHLNYAFAHVADGRISVGADGPENPATGMTWPDVRGAEMDESLPYRGHFNLLTRYKKLHPRVRTLISVGGWAESGGLYPMVANADGSVNQSGIDTFADSVVDFLRDYDFDGVDIDFEYPTILDQTGNPADWDVARPRRAGLPEANAALMRTLREKLDRASAADGTYYLLTSASSASGFVNRGMGAQDALRHQDFTNLMAYDYHGSWNDVVGPNAALFDDGKDPELAELYSTPEYDKIGYFNTDWAVHYLRGALQAGRVNIGVPYYTRGWRDVEGGDHGLWGSAPGTDCQPGTGIVRPCGDGAVGIDNIWHDQDASGGEVPAGVNPMWHAQNLQRGVLPRYAPGVGLTPDVDAADRLTGTYERRWDEATRTSWLWNEEKRTFLSTFDTQGVDEIVGYVKDSGAGGVMIWELGGDYTCPEEVTDQTPCGMGYDLTTRLHDGLGKLDAYEPSRRAGSAAGAVTRDVDVSVDLVDFAHADGLWPLQPKLRITNRTGVTLGGDGRTTVSFDMPTSTPALMKDGDWQSAATGGRWKVEAGHTGPNAGAGLSGTFHRVTLTLGYCEIIPAGTSLEIPLIHYAPATGPVNARITTGGATYAAASEHTAGVSRATPTAGGCAAPAWAASTVYNPSTQAEKDVTVVHDGKVWRAKWWTQGDVPVSAGDPDREPWKLVGPAR